MSTKELAKKLDGERRIVEASHVYEELITSSDADMHTYINLATIYFVANDLGFAAHFDLEPSFVEWAWRRIPQLLEEARQRFGNRVEIEFWQIYIPFILLGDEIDEKQLLNLIQKEQTLVPYLYLFIFTENGKHIYRKQAESLLEEVNDASTEKKRYIKSVLESGLRFS